MKALLVSLCLIPALAAAVPTVLVDAVPTGASFFNYATVQVPIPNLEKADPKVVEAGLASSISGVMTFAEKNGVTHICVISTGGDSAKSYQVGATGAKLKLQTINPSFVILLYREGSDDQFRFAYSLDRPDPNIPHMSIQIKKVEVPNGYTTAAWFYFNLSKIQQKALKDGATTIFIQSSGKGAKSTVIVPGVNTPLNVFDEESVISASWYVGNDKTTKAMPK